MLNSRPVGTSSSSIKQQNVPRFEHKASVELFNSESLSDRKVEILAGSNAFDFHFKTNETGLSEIENPSTEFDKLINLICNVQKDVNLGILSEETKTDSEKFTGYTDQLGKIKILNFADDDQNEKKNTFIQKLITLSTQQGFFLTRYSRTRSIDALILQVNEQRKKHTFFEKIRNVQRGEIETQKKSLNNLISELQKTKDNPARFKDFVSFIQYHKSIDPTDCGFTHSEYRFFVNWFLKDRSGFSDRLSLRASRYVEFKRINPNTEKFNSEKFNSEFDSFITLTVQDFEKIKVFLDRNKAELDQTASHNSIFLSKKESGLPRSILVFKENGSYRVLLKPKNKNKEAFQKEESKFVHKGGYKIVKTSALLMTFDENMKYQSSERYVTLSASPNYADKSSPLKGDLIPKENKTEFGNDGFKSLSFHDGKKGREIFIKPYLGENLFFKSEGFSTWESLPPTEKRHLALDMIKEVREKSYQDIKLDNILIQKGTPATIHFIDTNTTALTYLPKILKKIGSQEVLGHYEECENWIRLFSLLVVLVSLSALDKEKREKFENNALCNSKSKITFDDFPPAVKTLIKKGNKNKLTYDDLEAFVESKDFITA